MININTSVVGGAKIWRCRTVKFHQLSTRIFHGFQFIKSQKIPVDTHVFRNRAMLQLVNNFLFLKQCLQLFTLPLNGKSFCREMNIDHVLTSSDSALIYISQLSSLLNI